MAKTVDYMVESLDSHPKGETWTLSLLDQIVPSSYIRFILCISVEVSTAEDRERYFKSFQVGLQRTMIQIPFLGGVLREDNDGGRLHIASGPGVLLRWADLTDDDGLSYQKMKAAHFPSSDLDRDMLAPIGGVPKKTNAPVMAAQANFIPNGLLLSVCFHHLTVDAAAIGAVLRAWAENTRSTQESNLGPELTNSFPRELLDRTRLLSSGKVDPKEKVKEFPQYKLSALPPPPEKNSTEDPLPPPPTIPSIDSTVLYYSASKLSALKSLATPPTSSSTFYISTADAFTALLWHSITKARDLASNTGKDSSAQQSKLLFAINCRKLFDPPLPSSYLGNVIVYGSASQPILALTELSELPNTASAIRKAVAEIDNHHVQGLISLIGSLTLPADLRPNVDCFLGPDLAMTSWRDMGISGLDWGVGKVERVRVLASAFDGILLVLPTLEDGGLEVFVGLEAKAMERLVKDEELLRFAEVRYVSKWA